MRDQFEVNDKDPEFIYRWCNTDERAMLRHQSNGYEIVKSDKPELDLSGVKSADTPSTTGVTRRRGQDLVLCRIPRRAFEENIEARRRELRENQYSALDGSVSQANRDAVAAMKARGSTQKGLVFKSSDDADLSAEMRR